MWNKIPIILLVILTIGCSLTNKKPLTMDDIVEYTFDQNGNIIGWKVKPPFTPSRGKSRIYYKQAKQHSHNDARVEKTREETKIDHPLAIYFQNPFDEIKEELEKIRNQENQRLEDERDERVWERVKSELEKIRNQKIQ